MPPSRATHPRVTRRAAVLTAAAGATIIAGVAAAAVVLAPAAFSASPAATLQQAAASHHCVWGAASQTAALPQGNCNGVDITHADRDAIPALADALIAPADPAAWTGDYAFTADQSTRLQAGFRIDTRAGDLALWTRVPTTAPTDLPTL